MCPIFFLKTHEQDLPSLMLIRLSSFAVQEGTKFRILKINVFKTCPVFQKYNLISFLKSHFSSLNLHKFLQYLKQTVRATSTSFSTEATNILM